MGVFSRLLATLLNEGLDLKSSYLAGASILINFRGLGANKQLLHHRIAFAKEKGIKKVYVVTPVASASEYNMYKLGFKLLGARVKWCKE